MMKLQRNKSMKYIKIINTVLFMLIISGNIIMAQNDSSSIYENNFFTLDFEKDHLELSDVQKYFFTTFPHNDPTLGDVVYDRAKWKNKDLIKLNKNDGLYGYVKYRDDNSSFDSFRFTSKPYYNLKGNTKKILFVFKGEVPSGKGIWPAWWLNGSRQDEWLYKSDKDIANDEYLDSYSGKGEFYETPSPVNCTDWPAAGEIDIIETINGDNLFHNTIHTCPQMCDSEWNNSGEIINCANATAEDPNAGCSGTPYKLESPKGTFACLWEDNSITFYYWDPESDVRSEGLPLSKNPNPDQWKNNIKNYVRFLETDCECEDEKHNDWQCASCEGSNSCSFVNLKVIFNITLCGKWAGNKFDETENSFTNCQDYIVNKGKDLIDNQYLKIDFISVTKID